MKPSVMIVECLTWEEAELSAKKGLGDGYFSVGSGAGLVMFLDRNDALKLFLDLSESFLKATGLDMIAHCLVKDAQGTECIAFGVDTPKVTILYGVPEQEYSDYLQSLQEICPDCGGQHGPKFTKNPRKFKLH